jgi:cholesterol oxidase
MAAFDVIVIGSGFGGAVADHRGRVFGYPGLFVVDGSTLPGPVGRNPSLTIAALAERAAHLMVQEDLHVN